MPSTADPTRFHRSMPGYEPGPLLDVPELARSLGIGALLVKDLSSCFGLPAFKIVGASWGVNRAIATRLGLPPAETFAELKARAASLPGVRLVTATDGNHGRALAHMGALLELPATIYVPAGTVPARTEAIAAEGARVEVVQGSYDDTVTRAARDASEGCLLVSDTSWPGYEDTPQAVIDGYATLLREIDGQLGALAAPQPDVVLVQCGVGAFPAAVGAHYAGGGFDPGDGRDLSNGRDPGDSRDADERRPALIGVEPDDAACMLESLAAGRIVTVPGPHRSIMAGLNCGTLSLVAWPVLAATFDACLSIDDGYAVRAMRLLAAAGIESGESGAAGLAGLLALCEAPELAPAREALAIGPQTRALVFSTEGATDPRAYARIVAGG